jgi:hypothetical protein
MRLRLQSPGLNPLNFVFCEEVIKIAFYHNKFEPDLLMNFIVTEVVFLVDTNLFVYVTSVCQGNYTGAKNTEVLF